MSSLPIVLIVIENGATWPEWVDRCRADADVFSESSRVLVQDESESPIGFAARVESYLAEHAHIAIGAIACSERCDASAVDARRSIANHLARAMSKDKRGRLCLSEPKRSSGRARHALSSLATELEQQWSESGLEVSVRFSSDRELTSRVA